MSDKPRCQADTTRKFVCNQPAAHEVEEVPLCGRHREVLSRRGGIQILRSPAYPVEAIVDMGERGNRIYDAAPGHKPA